MVALARERSRSEAIAELTEVFLGAGIEAPMIDARVLVCAAAEIDHAGLLRDPDLAMGDAAALVSHHARRRLSGEPVARILGMREFWSLRFRVTPDVLDPRADSEALIEAALAHMGARRLDGLRILDLGTGSGALLAAMLTEWPRARGVGIDKSEPACAIARDNLEALGLAARAVILCGDWTQPLSEGAFDLIVSNPPYIETAAIAALAAEVRTHDPLTALDGGPDGLDCYRQLAALLPRHLAPNGLAFVEIGIGQAGAVSKIMTASSLRIIDIAHDLAGTERALVLGHAAAA